MSTLTLKRSLKRLSTAAAAGGWEPNGTKVDNNVVHLHYVLTGEPPEAGERDYATRRFLAATRITITGAADTGAWFGASATDGNGDTVGHVKLDTVFDVENLLLFRKRHLDEAERAAARRAELAREAEERRAIRDAYVAEIEGTWRYDYVRTIAHSTPEAPEGEERLNWMRRSTEAYFTAVLAKRMAESALAAVGWPVDVDGGSGTWPLGLSAALGKGVAEVMSNESGSGLDSALVAAAREVLRSNGEPEVPFYDCPCAECTRMEWHANLDLNRRKDVGSLKSFRHEWYPEFWDATGKPIEAPGGSA